jgi:class 3 adenylate cyclase
MSHLPEPVVNYIQELIIEDRSPAYLLVRKDGRLLSWGGKLSLYGFTNIRQGEAVERQFLFLAGLLPFEKLPMLLPCIKMESGVAADVHIFTADENDWILLLDASRYENQYSIVQQQANDLSLIRQYQSRFLQQSLHHQVAANLSLELLQLLEKGDRRDVTILLAKICSFNSFIEDCLPEEVLRTLNSYVSAIMQPLLDEGGMVNKVVGDAVTSLFGVLPVTGSPPVHAMKAAVRIVETVREVSKVRQADKRIAFDVAISIVSGSLVVGIIGSQNQKTFIAVGHQMALVEQLGYQTSPSEIAIDENTYNQIGEMQPRFTRSHTLCKEIASEPIPIFTLLVA